MSEDERRTADPTGEAAEGEQAKRWQTEFPYHWDADDLVSRRELLHFAVSTSGALFAGTVLLAILGLAPPPARADEQPIARAADVSEGSAFYFNYPGPADGAVLLHLPGGGFVAYSQRCTHLSCSVFYQEERRRLLCPCHEGVFDPRTGEPVAGPPRRRLPQIALRQEGDQIYAVGIEP